jgi:hypothetical protein
MGKVKKRAANGDQVKPTADSTGYYSKKVLKSYGEKDFAGAKKASDDVARQSKKGKPGYDANGFPVKKKMKSGGELGMKSVKSGYDDNAGVTRADFVAMGKGEAKHGAKMMKMGGAAAKQAAIAIAMKKAGKTPKKKMNYGGKAASMAPKKAMGGMKMMKGGGKCKYGC